MTVFPVQSCILAIYGVFFEFGTAIVCAREEDMTFYGHFNSDKKGVYMRFISAISFVLFSQAGLANVCEDVEVQVLGSGGPELNDGRASSSYLIWYKGESRVLVDTGSGSSVQFDHAHGDMNTLDAIVFSHFHSDHSADFASYIKGAFFTPRDKPLVIAGPSGNRLMPSTIQFVDRQIGESGAFQYLADNLDDTQQQYPIRVVNQPANRISEEVSISSTIRIQSLPVEHGPIAAVAWKINVAGCVITYTGDMNGTNKDFAAFSRNADLAIMHAAIDEHASGVATRLHMRPSDIAAIANDSAAKRILLSHFMNRSAPQREAIRALVAKETGKPVLLAEDLMKVQL